MDENNLLNELHQSTKKELQQVISQLEEQLQEYKAGGDALKSEFENLKAEVAEKPLLQKSLKELEEQLVKTEAQLAKEVDYHQLQHSQMNPQNKLLVLHIISF
jgi:predicted RNase H-like nuclease (RuvC/YqgF family)